MDKENVVSYEYVKYNSKNNPHWGKQPRGYYFTEIKSWREDLDTDYDIEIESLDDDQKPPIDCIDHSQVKPLPGTTSFNDITYPTDGVDVITLGLQRLQGIKREDEHSTPTSIPDDPNAQPDTDNLQQFISSVLNMINNEYYYESNTYFYTQYNDAPINALVIFNREDTSLYTTGIVLSDYKDFYLLNGDGTILISLTNENNGYQQVYDSEQDYELYISPEYTDDEHMVTYGAISGRQNETETAVYPTIIIAIP